MHLVRGTSASSLELADGAPGGPFRPHGRPRDVQLGSESLLRIAIAAEASGFRLDSIEVGDDRALPQSAEVQREIESRLIDAWREIGPDAAIAEVRESIPAFVVTAVTLIDPNGRSVRLTRDGEIDSTKQDTAERVPELASSVLFHR